MSYKRPILIDLAIIFTLALALRLLYLGNLENLVFQEGDAYYFLRGGENLLNFTHELFSGHIHDLAALGAASQNDALTMSSTSLADRLINDGPIITTFMAVFEGLSGFKPGVQNFDSKFQAIAAFISIWQALGCVFVYLAAYLAFGKRSVARLAGLLISLNPSAIINIQSCYSELICFPLFSLWLLMLLALRLQIFPVPKYWCYLATGLVSAVLMLSKPVFWIAPFFLIPCLFSYQGWTRASLAKQTVSALVFLFGAALVFAPWLVVSNSITGHPMLSVYRSPAFNLFIGNNLARDGWRASPWPENIPVKPQAAVSLILENLKKDPGAMIAMEATKFPRLFSGAWNEFQRKLFGVSPRLLEYWHQTILALAVLGLTLGFASTRKNERRFTTLFAAAIAVHFSYLLVEPISRYNFTLAPVFSILAAFAIFRLFELECLPLTIVALPAGIFVLTRYKAVCQLLCQSLSFSAAQFLTAGFYFSLIILLFSGLCYRLIRQESRPLRAVLASSVALPLAAVFAISIMADRETGGWTTTLNQDSHYKQVFKLKPLEKDSAGKYVYLLFDIKTDINPYPLKLKLNGKNLKALAFPWIMLERDRSFLDLLDIQLKGMNGNASALRQWWAVPVETTMLDFSAENTIELSAGAQKYATLWGSFDGNAGNKTYMPSESLCSWTKGFTTYDREDFRLYTPEDRSATKSFIWREDKWQEDDLSRVPLLQKGNFNIKVIAVSTPGQSTTADLSQNIVYIKNKDVTGSNPLSSVIAGAQTKSFTSKAGSLFIVSGHGLGDNKHEKFVIQTFFESKDGKTYTSPFEPRAIDLKATPHYFSFADFLPASFNNQTVRVKLMALPYTPGLLFLQKRKALKQNLNLKELRLDIVEQPGLMPFSDATCTQLNY